MLCELEGCTALSDKGKGPIPLPILWENSFPYFICSPKDRCPVCPYREQSRSSPRGSSPGFHYHTLTLTPLLSLPFPITHLSELGAPK